MSSPGLQNSIFHSPGQRPFAVLKQFARQRVPEVERCELCSLALPPEHDHLVETNSRRLLCSCGACALLFDAQADTKYRRVPRYTWLLNDFSITDAQWDGFMIPINMAFFFYSSPDQRMVAMYPSPAGPVESLLSFEAWQEMTQHHSALINLQPDVEALLVNRLGERRGFPNDEYYLAPIDQCYKLVGLLRMYWRGLSGGSEVWDEVRNFFGSLKKTG